MEPLIVETTENSSVSAEVRPEKRIPSFCVVLPMFNEEGCAQPCVQTIYGHIKNIATRTAVICVDDGSTDRTGELLTQMQSSVPTLIIEKHVVNQGYGAANVTGAKRAAAEGFEYVLFMDGDLTQRVSYIDDFVIEMQNGTDFIKATRYSKGGGVDGVPFKRWLVSYVGNLLAKMFFRLPIRDYTNGFRAIRTDLVKKLEAKERGFAYLIEEVYQISKIAKTYAEVPYVLTVRQDTLSTSKFSYSVKTYYNYFKYLVKK
jgi:glycosyltransferase involved in cell wall biosynthesis